MNSPFQPTQEEYRPPSHVMCKYCDKPIYIEDRSVYMHHGELGRGSKSGQPVVKDADNTSGDAIVHELCSIAYLTSMVVDSSDEAEAVLDSLTADIFGMSYSELASQEDFCAACEAKIDGND